MIAVHTIDLKQKLRQLSAETHLTANNNLCAKVFPLVIFLRLNSLCCYKNHPELSMHTFKDFKGLIIFLNITFI